MVVKTELCAFSEYRIYPGHGMKVIRRDSQPMNIISSKCKSLVNQRKKPSQLTWTVTWRRLNKKGNNQNIAKKRTKKAAKIQRAIVGATLVEIKALKKPKSAAELAAIKELKEKKKAAVKTAAKSGPGGKSAVPKLQKSAQASKR
jgi:large subunit ribosomal protein L24e